MSPAGRYAVRVQGVDRQLGRATGEDDEHDLGALTVEEIGTLADRLLALAPGDGECPPQLLVAGALGAETLVIEEGVIRTSTGLAVGRSEALARIAGRNGGSAGPARFPRGMVPVRRAEIAPTPAEVKESARLIDSGHAVAHAAVATWKHRGWSAGGWLLLGLGVFLALIGALTLLPGPGRSTGTASVFFGVALACGAGYLALRALGRDAWRVGVDWRTNTLWLARAGGLAFEPHANCIRDVRVRKLRAADGIQFANGMPTKRGSDFWILEIEYSDARAFFALQARFLARGEAEAVAAHARRLLAA